MEGILYIDIMNKHDEVVRLREQGFSYRKIAEKLGIGATTAREWYKKWEESQPSIGDYIRIIKGPHTGRVGVLKAVHHFTNIQAKPYALIRLGDKDEWVLLNWCEKFSK